MRNFIQHFQVFLPNELFLTYIINKKRKTYKIFIYLKPTSKLKIDAFPDCTYRSIQTQK